MADEDKRYRIGDETYTYDELREVTEAEVADLPPETWCDGKFNFDDYLTESVQAGTIDVIEPDLSSGADNQSENCAAEAAGRAAVADLHE